MSTDQEVTYHRSFLSFDYAYLKPAGGGRPIPRVDPAFDRYPLAERARRYKKLHPELFEKNRYAISTLLKASYVEGVMPTDETVANYMGRSGELLQGLVRAPEGWIAVPNALGRRKAISRDGGGLHWFEMFEKTDQNFEKYATSWELRYSNLVYPYNRGFTPIVDDSWHITGYYGDAHSGLPSGKDLIVPLGLQALRGDLNDALVNGLILFVGDGGHPPTGWAKAPGLSSGEELGVVTTIDGEVLEHVTTTINGGVEPVDFSPLDILLAAKLFVDLGVAGVSKLTRSLVLKETANREARIFLRGPTEQMAKRVEERVLKRMGTRMAKLVKSGHGYDVRMGIPEEHLKAMIEAAKETNVTVVFRANKAAAIPLIKKGAVPKAKYFTFKSSPKTGVLMATEPAHVATAYQHGYYVVEADGVARRMFNGAKQELQIPDPFWSIEKGQVIAPNAKPVVGDYDLLGVLPNESPGRNVVGVPDDPLKGDWNGPDVQKYADALNKKLDQPRVLHGAQDGFRHDQYGGLTDDTAYAVHGDGSHSILEGRAAQKAFYKAHGRETVMGSYPRPSSGTPVRDELAPRRAGK
ncbi:MAG: hypothetical protein ACJ8FY_15905 [Gemmataceae bacterium]